MEEQSFANYFQMYPMTLSEKFVILSILHSLKEARHSHKHDKHGHEHIKHLANAHRKLQSYFDEKGIKPEDY
jgi:hypothetical protein